MTAQANRIRLAAEHGALAVNAGTLMRIQAKEDLIERVGNERVQVVEGASRTETRSAEIHHQAKTDITHRATRRIDLTAGKNAELVAGRHLVVNARNNAKVTVRGKGGTVIAVQGGNLTFQAAGDIRITGKGGGDITFEQSGAGFKIDPAGNVHMWGKNIALGGDGGVSFGGPVNWNIGSPSMPGEAGVSAPLSASAIENLIDETEEPEPQVRDLEILVTNELLEAHAAHLSLMDDIAYVLTTDMGDVRKGKVKDGKIIEKAVNIKAKLRIEFDEVLPI